MVQGLISTAGLSQWIFIYIYIYCHVHIIDLFCHVIDLESRLNAVNGSILVGNGAF